MGTCRDARCRYLGGQIESAVSNRPSMELLGAIGPSSMMQEALRDLPAEALVETRAPNHDSNEYLEPSCQICAIVPDQRRQMAGAQVHGAPVFFPHGPKISRRWGDNCATPPRRP